MSVAVPSARRKGVSENANHVKRSTTLLKWVKLKPTDTIFVLLAATKRILKHAHNKSLQLTFDSLPGLATPSPVIASNAAELRRWASEAVDHDALQS